MKSHMCLLQVVLNEMGTRCRTSTIQDWKTILKRVEHEGLSFLTITLPAFCSDFQKSLEIGQVDSSLFLSFRKRGGLPLFLGGYLSLVFDRGSGRLLNDPDIDSIQAIRQICLLYSKVELPCSDARRHKAFVKYIQCEQQVKACDSELDPSCVEEFNSMSLRLFGDLFSRMDLDAQTCNYVPKHGPGTTADKLVGNAKYSQRTWTERLEKVFPFGEFLIPNWRYFNEVSPTVDLLEPGAEIPVHVISVPKTLKTPRIIAVEPTCMQYAQQAVLESFLSSLRGDDFLRRVIGIDDQPPNREMARDGSLNGTLATLDLSEASDRVSNQLVRGMLRPWPHLFEAVDACRSRKADVPQIGVVRLSKFASMGSALCFPIEAVVFLTIVFLGIQSELKRPLTRKDFYSFLGRVRVYGDDIIVPVEYVRSVIGKLNTFGCLVNSDKSFWTGKFRESCGKEYYDGHDVSVVKARRMLPTSRKCVPEIISAVSLRNQFYFAGSWWVCRWLDQLIERFLPFPYVDQSSQALGRHSYLGYETQRLCPYLHRPLVKAGVVVSRIPKSNLDGFDALLKWFLKRGDEPIADRRHLERAGRPDSVDIKIRWVLAD